MNLHHLLHLLDSPDPLLEQIRNSPSAPLILNFLRATKPERSEPIPYIPQTTYSLYRQFALNGDRTGYETPYFEKRSQLTLAVVELILGNEAMIDLVHDLLWSICEETSWVLPAHEDRDSQSTLDPTWPFGTYSTLNREPDFIDLFAAETGASLAETVYLLGDRLAPEVVQRVRQEVERHIFRPYLAYARSYWWHTGDLNWNGVCNGAIGLAFIRLERDPNRLAEALTLVLEGFEAYMARGFEADGGSLEGISYWNYGLLYFVALAELLRERTAGQLDLLSSPRIVDIARFPLAMALAPGQYLNFGDATERTGLEPGIVQRLAERTGLADLSWLLLSPEHLATYGSSTIRLAIVLRDIAWWDGGQQPFPATAHQDSYLPACALIKFTGLTQQGQPVILAAKAGRNDGHHYHMDIGHFIVNVAGESLLCDPGRGLYTRAYFGEGRFENAFCNSYGHSVPRIGGHLQMPGPKFGTGRLAQGEIVEQTQSGGEKEVAIDFASLYDLPELTGLRRKLRLDAGTGEIWLEDSFEFHGAPLEIEEALITWDSVFLDGARVRVTGQRSGLDIVIQEPDGAKFAATRLEQECRANRQEGTLTRLTVTLPLRAKRCILRMTPLSIDKSHKREGPI